MLKIHSEPPQPKASYQGPVLLALGFRPFFLVAGLSALLLLFFWIGIWSGLFSVSGYYGSSIGWHSHEMLFGYVAAVIAGFLLTAVRNWTGVNTPSGTPLGGLLLLWLAGRLAPLAQGLLPDLMIALVDLAFLPAVALSLLPPLWQGKQKINRIFVPIMLVMALANLLVHLQSLGVAQSANGGIDMMLFLVIFLITLIGGRVVPFFTQAVVPGYQAKRIAWVETASMVTMVGLVLAQPFQPAPWLVGPLAAAAALLQMVRLWGWHHPGAWGTPILWVLYTGLLWVIAGLLLVALASAGLVGMHLAKHALAVGGIGLMTLGMMARVALGHTGRPIEPRKMVELSFLLLNLGALLRVFGPMLLPEHYFRWIHFSGGFWMLAFLIFCWVYLPILTRPRVDGKPG